VGILLAEVDGTVSFATPPVSRLIGVPMRAVVGSRSQSPLSAVLSQVNARHPGGAAFKVEELPLQAQFSPVFTITELDYDKDGKSDLLLCGNINHARLRFGKSDANYGVLMKGDGKGNFSYISQQQSGFHIWGDVRSVIHLNNMLFFGINQQPVKAYKVK